GGGSSGGGGSDSSNYKHEGDSVNTELRLDKTKIQFFDTGGGSGKAASQTQPVGYYDKQKKQWKFNNSNKTQNGQCDQNHCHMLFGGMAIWVDSSGCWSSQPIQQKGDPGFLRDDYDGTPASYARVMGYDAPKA